MNFDAASAILVLAALGALFYGPWQDLCTSYARQVGFEKRDAIFDMALVKQLEFKSTEYRAIRRSIEQLIRFAHELNLAGFILQAWFLSQQRRAPEKSHLSQAIASIKDPVVRAQVKQLVWEAHRAMIIMMLAKSPLTVPAAIAFLLMKWKRATLPSNLSAFAVPAAERIQLEAEHVAAPNPRNYALVA